jgi:hypothetical protein
VQAHLSEAAAHGVAAGQQPAPGQQHAAQRLQQPSSQQAVALNRSSPAAPAADVETDAAAAADLSSLPRKSQQPLQLHRQSAATQVGGGSSITIGSSLRRHLDQAAQQRHQQQQAHDVYANLRDPTAAATGVYIIPQELVQQHEQARWLRHSPPNEQAPTSSSRSAAAAAETDHAAGNRAAAAPGAAARTSSTAAAAADPDATPLKSSLREKLLASAPELPISGTDWLLAHYSVNQHSMELYNHWGAVDASVSIPQDRCAAAGPALIHWHCERSSTPAGKQARKHRERTMCMACTGSGCSWHSIARCSLVTVCVGNGCSNHGCICRVKQTASPIGRLC